MPADQALRMLAEYQRLAKIVKVHFALIAGQNDSASRCQTLRRD